jgi:hypothetical protein
MSAVQTGGIEQELGESEFASIVSELLRRDALERGARAESHCVWSSKDGCCCHETIPTEAVTAAWQRELDAGAEREDRFFHFIYEGGVWLAYGLANGEVRGVYCPSHNTQRAERSHASICAAEPSCGVGEIVYELPLAA